MAGRDYLTSEGHVTQDRSLSSEGGASVDGAVGEIMDLRALNPEPAPDLSAVRPHVGPRNPHALGEQLHPSGLPMNPMEQDAAARTTMLDLGVERFGPSAGRAAGWVPQSRTSAIPDFYGDERQNIAARERGTARDERDIGYDENELARIQAREMEVEAHEEVIKKQNRAAEIDAEVSRQRGELDEAMSRQKELLNKGISSWEHFGSGSKAQGQMSAALTLAAGSFGGPESGRQVQGMIDGIIDREIGIQKFEMLQAGQYADNMYKRLMDRYDDADQAEAALRILMGEATKAELQSMVLETADPNTKLNADKQINEIDKRLLEQNDFFRARSIGKLTEKWDAGAVASAGGIRNLSPERWSKWLSSSSTRAGTQADTIGALQKQGRDARAELVGGSAEMAAHEKAINDIPEGVRTKMIGMMAINKNFEDVVKAAGGSGFNQETGEIYGLDDIDDIPATGPYDAGLTAIGLGNERDVNMEATFESFKHGMLRPDVGANFTKMEEAKTDKFTTSWRDRNQKVQLVAMGKMLANKYNSNRQAITPRSRDAWDRQQSGFAEAQRGDFGDVGLSGN